MIMNEPFSYMEEIKLLVITSKKNRGIICTKKEIVCMKICKSQIHSKFVILSISVHLICITCIYMLYLLYINQDGYVHYIL